MANEMKFTGKVTVITPMQKGESANGKVWTKQTVIIQEDKDQYPQSIAIEAFNKEEEVNKLSIGCTCDVYFNMSAKEYQGRYFGSNGLWKFDNVIGSVAPTAQVPPTQAPAQEEGTGLPFN